MSNDPMMRKAPIMSDLLGRLKQSGTAGEEFDSIKITFNIS